MTKRTDHLIEVYKSLNLDLLKRLDLLPINTVAELEAVCVLSYLYDHWLQLKDQNITDEEREAEIKRIHEDFYLNIPGRVLLREIDLAVAILRPAIEEKDYFKRYRRFKATGIPTNDAKEYVCSHILVDRGRMNLSPFAFELSPNIEEKLNELKSLDWDNMRKAGFNTRLLNVHLGYSPGALWTRKSRKKKT